MYKDLFESTAAQLGCNLTLENEVIRVISGSISEEQIQLIHDYVAGILAN